MKSFFKKTTAIGLFLALAFGPCYPQATVPVLFALNRPNPTIVRIKIKKILKKKKAVRKALRKKMTQNQTSQSNK